MAATTCPSCSYFRALASDCGRCAHHERSLITYADNISCALIVAQPIVFRHNWCEEWQEATTQPITQ